jgi:hypothetical protein
MDIRTYWKQEKLIGILYHNTEGHKKSLVIGLYFKSWRIKFY